MLAADKLLLQSNVKQRAIQLREKELNLFNDKCEQQPNLHPALLRKRSLAIPGRVLERASHAAQECDAPRLAASMR